MLDTLRSRVAAAGFVRLGVLIFLAFFAAANSLAGERDDAVRFCVVQPQTILRDVPLRQLVVEATDSTGDLLEEFEETVVATGLRLVDGDEAVSEFTFEAGRLTLASDLASNRKVLVSGAISFEVTGETSTESVPMWPGWVSILPPLVAIVLAILCQEVLLSLLLGIWTGAVLLAGGDLLGGSLTVVDSSLVNELADRSHAQIILFTLMLGGMVRILSDSGATAALVRRLAGWTATRERTQTLTSFLGIAVFFDDYANTLFVGSTMRPLTDAKRISREKLAFLVDATAAPVAGLAIISTWVGIELGYIADTYAELGLGSDVYGLFLQTIPYRFYPVLLLVFVWMIAATGRDFGPMARVEADTVRNGVATGPAIASEPADDAASERRRDPQTIWPAIVPLAVLLVTVVGRLLISGYAGLSETNTGRIADDLPPLPITIGNLLDQSSPNESLLLAAMLSTLVAAAIASGGRFLSLTETGRSFIRGVADMMPAMAVLLLAWGIATVCDAEHLNTAGYLVQATSGYVSAAWMPLLAFLLAGVVSFSTGSSWSTMGLLMPLSISIAFALLIDDVPPDVLAGHPVMLGTIGAVLAGALFGDHCSPISDTTILSSAASGCDHLSHVATQFPYALTVAGVSIVCGYIPLGFGFTSTWILIPVGMVTLFAIVRLAGKRVVQDEKPTV